MSYTDKKRQEEEALKSMVTLLHQYEISQIPEKEDLKERYQLSDIFYHNMDKIIEKQEKKARRRSIRRGCTAAAAVAAVLFSLANPQMVAQGAEWMVYWFKDRVSFQFKVDTDVNWVPRYEFGYVPEGFEKVMDEYYEGAGYIFYENEQGNRFVLDYGVVDGGLVVDSENKDYDILTGSHGETIHYLHAKDLEDDSSLTWISDDETTKFNLLGDLSEEEMLKIQENIRMAEEK